MSSTVGRPPEKSLTGEDEDGKMRTLERYREILSELPKVEGWGSEENMWQYEGFWFLSDVVIQGYMWIQQNFKPRPEDLLLITYPKSGTTWFKSLIFSITNRTRFDFSTHPLLTSSPHDLVSHLEFYLFQNIPFPKYPDDDVHDQKHKFYHSHMPFSSFSQSMIDSGCRIVYVCRDPKDVFVSFFFFLQKRRDKKLLPPYSLEKAFDMYCNGVSPLGPIWDHVLGYWKASLESSERVMFMKYQDMKTDPSFHLKRLAQFVGYPFSVQEENEGVVDEIIRLCSFENLSSLKANKTGVVTAGQIIVEKNTFFRKGEVGDWRRHLTAEMANRLDQIVEKKLAGSGLTFLISC